MNDRTLIRRFARPSPGGRRESKRIPVRNHRRQQPSCLQHFAQGLTSACRVRCNQHAARITAQKVVQGIGGGVVFGGQRQGGCGLHWQRVGLTVARMLRTTDLDTTALVETLAQMVGCKP